MEESSQQVLFEKVTQGMKIYYVWTKEPLCCSFRQESHVY